MVGRGEARAGLDDRRGHPEALVDLGELAARRAATEDQQASWQLPGQRRLLVGPRLRGLETRHLDALRERADGDDHVVGGQVVVLAVVADPDDAAVDDASLTAVDRGARLLERFCVARVVRLRGVGRAVDHVVATDRRARPFVGRRVLVMLVCAVQQRLGRDAADVRATATEPALVRDRDRGAQLARLVRSRLTGGAGADHNEVERRAHPGQSASVVRAARCRRAS